MDPEYESVNNTFERALVFMHKMPRIWIDYCQFLMKQKKITRTRKVCMILALMEYFKVYTVQCSITYFTP